MLRIIDGIAFVGQRSPDRWEVSTRNLGGGHVELSVNRSVDWVEAQWSPDKARADLIDKHGLDEVLRRDAEALAEREAANLARAGRRAKTRVRHLCKAQGLDTLFTLTYRDNMTDERRAWADLKAFTRRMRALLGSFAYVAVHEVQARGAIHWHLAIHRLPVMLAARNGVKVKSYNVVRAIWRSVVGLAADGQPGGNIDQARRRRSAQKSAAKIATYIAKYVAKGFADQSAGANRYSASMGVVIPRAARREVRADSLAALLGVVYVDAFGAELRLCSAWLCPYGDGAYFAGEVVTDRGGGP